MFFKPNKNYLLIDLKLAFMNLKFIKLTLAEFETLNKDSSFIHVISTEMNKLTDDLIEEVSEVDDEEQE